MRDDVARELTYTGRIFDGEEAVRMGLATRVWAPTRAEPRPWRWAAAEIGGRRTPR